MISYVLRLTSPVAPRERLKEIWRQLSGIGGGRSLGFGPNRVRSLPDGVAQALVEYLESSELHELVPPTEGQEGREHDPEGGNGYNLRSESALTGGQESGARDSLTQPELFVQRVGDLCPECGQAAVVNEEGCRKCYACGFSEC